VYHRPVSVIVGRSRVATTYGIVAASQPLAAAAGAQILERGGSAVDAAGKIHTDLAKGFIRAEVTAYDDLARLGSMKEVKAKNLQRLEGKDYVVKDGDIMYFRSSV